MSGLGESIGELLPGVAEVGAIEAGEEGSRDVPGLGQGFAHEFPDVADGLLGRDAPLDGPGQIVAGLAADPLGRESQGDEGLLVGLGLDGRLSPEEEGRGARRLGELPGDEIDARLDDADHREGRRARERRPVVDDRQGVAGDEEDVGAIALVHGPQDGVEDAVLLGLGGEAVVAGAVEEGVVEDDAGLAEDAAFGKPGGDVGGDGEPAQSGVRHQDGDVLPFRQDLVDPFFPAPGRSVTGRGEKGGERGERDERVFFSWGPPGRQYPAANPSRRESAAP